MKKEAKPANKKVSQDAAKLNEILVENFVNLQRAITHLTLKFDRLAEQISTLLQLFEISARSFADKLEKAAPDLEKDKEFLDKLDKLLDQNKVIAKGLTLMEEKLRERVYGHLIQPARQPSPAFPSQPIRRPIMPAQPQPAQQESDFLPSVPSPTNQAKAREI